MMVPDWVIKVIISFASFLLFQTGVLIWFLSAINNRVKVVEVKVDGTEQYKNDVAVLKERCRLHHNNRSDLLKNAPKI